MHRLATVHARDDQPTTNDVTTQPISISASFTFIQRIRGFTSMRYINRLFTYLLTYLLT